MRSERIRMVPPPKPTSRGIVQPVSHTPSLDAEREAYMNLALVRLRGLRAEVEQSLTRLTHEGTTRSYSYGSYESREPTREEYVGAALKKIDAAIARYEEEARDVD